MNSIMKHQSTISKAQSYGYRNFNPDTIVLGIQDIILYSIRVLFVILYVRNVDDAYIIIIQVDSVSPFFNLSILNSESF